MPDGGGVMLAEEVRAELVDIESAEWVWEQILARRGQQTAIVFASSDLDELLRYSDRIAVFFAGRVLAVIDAKTAGADDLGRLIGGSERVS